jgi:hypothetical protein
MNKNDYYKSLAHDTWPQFERKMRRVRLFQKAKKWFLWIASGFVLLWGLTMLLSPQQAKRNFNVKKLAKIQALKLPKSPSVHPSNKSKWHASNLHLFDSTAPHQTVQERIASWNTIQTFYPKVAQSKTRNLKHRADLTLACAQLNIQPQTWSLQENGHSFCALIDEYTLMFMNLMYGSENLPAYPTDMNTESWYRPEFFPSDQFIHIAFYEVGEWIQDPLTIRLNMNRLSDKARIAPWLVSSNSVRNYDGSDLVFNTFDRELPNHFVYRGLDSKFYRSPMLQYHKNLYVADRPATSFNPLLFHHADTLIAITAQAQRITKLSMNGIVYNSKEIIYRSKGMHSLKRLEPILDPVENKLYVLAPTNFHFVFFKVDLQTGEAKQVYQTTSVWKGAEFEIRNGQLFYLYKGDLQTVVLEPN